MAAHPSGVLIAGTSSDAGKSLVVTGLCRHLARQGLSVAPFKAQNMSNNSVVCADGSEIGRAQYLQATAARVEPESAMNPVLLKPGSDRRSFVVLRGRPAGTLEAGEYATGRKHLAEAAYAAYEELSERFDLVVCEGAGSPAEINLRAGDYVNLGLARRFDLPVVVVGDIDRGGVFASLYGTVALLEPEDRAMIRAFLVNKFRGDRSVLEPGLTELTRRAGVPFAGVLPWLPDLELDAEDTLEIGRWRAAAPGPDQLRVAVVRLPRVSNVTDVDALAVEPGVEVLVTTNPDVVRGADLAVLPGSRATWSDLEWLHRTGLADAVRARVRRAAPVLGICGGYQMLAGWIDDPVESGRSGPGLGLLPTSVAFAEDKVLGRPTGSWRGAPVQAYEIHHGVATATGDGEPFLDGWRVGETWGTMWHGAMENDAFRRAWLGEVAAAAGSSWRAQPGAPAFAARREAMIDQLADAVGEHVDVELVLGRARPSRGSGSGGGAVSSDPSNPSTGSGGGGGSADPSGPSRGSGGGSPSTDSGGGVASTGAGAGGLEVLVIGIGTGDPQQLTQEAVAALNQVDVFLVADKGPDKDDLVALRDEICRAAITHDRYRFVPVADPPRGPDRDRDAHAYASGVDVWHRRRAERYADVIRRELGPDGTVGFLVWGDPSLYDSTIRIVELVRGTGLDLRLRVLPGISSLQLLAARHQIVLNRVGRPIHITTGRRLLGEYDPALGDVAVLLDGDLACAGLVANQPELTIYWGAQLGLPDETLVAGPLPEVIEEIRTARAAARDRRGWVMDTYLLRPTAD